MLAATKKALTAVILIGALIAPFSGVAQAKKGGGTDNKTTICFIPPDDPTNPKKLTIGVNAAERRLATDPYTALPGGMITAMPGFKFDSNCNIVDARPEAPTITSAQATGTSGSVDVTFTAGADNGSAITDYDIEYSTDANFEAGNGQLVENDTSAALTQTVTDLANGTTYYFRVRATNAVGDSPWSAVSLGAAPNAAPEAPTITSAQATGTSGSVDVTFTAGADNGSAITDYDIEYSTDANFEAGNGQLVENDTSAALTQTVTDLANGTTYYFRVRATNAVGDSPWSAVSEGVTLIALPTVSEDQISRTRAATFRVKGYNTGSELFLGPMSSSSLPRVEANFNEFQTVVQKTYKVTFSFDKAANLIQGSIESDTSTKVTVVYDFDTQTTGPNCPVQNWNMLEIFVRDSLTTSAVALENVKLGEFSLGNFGTLDKAGLVSTGKYWTVTGFDFSQGFTVTADMLVDGFLGNEAMKIEFNPGCSNQG